jgi:hypothetical protein
MGVLRQCAAAGKKSILASQHLRMQRVAAAGAATGLLALGFYSASDVQAKFDIVSATGPLVRLLDAETSHRVGILAAKLGFFPRETRKDPDSLRVDIWGKQFRNPLGEEASHSRRLRWTARCCGPLLRAQVQPRPLLQAWPPASTRMRRRSRPCWASALASWKWVSCRGALVPNA